MNNTGDAWSRNTLFSLQNQSYKQLEKKKKPQLFGATILT